MGHSWFSAVYSLILYREGRGASTAYTPDSTLYTVYIMVDISSIDAILYIQLQERLEMNKASISIRIMTSISMIIVMGLSTGCSSLSTGYQGDQDSVKNAFMRGLSRGSGGHETSWDPAAWMGYGARIPNMEGDWERFCKQDPARCG